MALFKFEKKTLIICLIALHMSLYLSAAPIFTQEMCDIEEVEDSCACFQVKITGEQPIEVKWCDEEGALDENDVRIDMEEDEAKGVYTLTITELRMEDSGTYTCEATNKHGKTISEATIGIEPMPDTARKLVDKVAHLE